MAVLDRAAAKVAKIIRRFGKPITYIQVTGGTFNTTTLKVDGAMEKEFPIKGIIGALKREDAKASDLMVTVAAADLPGKPNKGSALEVAGVRYRITKIDPLYSGALIVTYNLEARV